MSGSFRNSRDLSKRLRNCGRCATPYAAVAQWPKGAIWRGIGEMKGHRGTGFNGLRDHGPNACRPLDPIAHLSIR